MASQLSHQQILQDCHDLNNHVVPSNPLQWSVVHAPAVNNQATASKTAVAGQRHVCTSITATLVADGTGGSAVSGSVVLRDGATGAGTVLWQAAMAFAGTANTAANPIVISGLNIVGSTNTAMTLEFSAGPGTHSQQAVTMTGYTTI